MNFRPCIDIHNGKVKQIIGSSLKDAGDEAENNFVSDRDASYFAEKYREYGLRGGHIILLNPADSKYYEEDCVQAEKALGAFPGGMQAGGGMNAENSGKFIDMGASHVIVTSYVFRDGDIDMSNLKKMVKSVGRERLVLDLSCRKRDGRYYIVTDRWQKFTDLSVDHGLLDRLSEYCDEYLVHAVDVEGKKTGIDEELARLLGSWKGIPVTYAGGVKSLSDLETLYKYGKNLDVTIGSSLDLFGGELDFDEVVEFCRNKK